ncbi:hypothetical protein [Bradyrhizobium sp. Bra78]|uniref:hypothetical protein n=1 Tax=Bradyrhizobium sp. Bra78 TaxID=2926010 RepID=UPI0021CA16F2|nr:hypothetical protein [Bradyrhizobium sp. Bra78]
MEWRSLFRFVDHLAAEQQGPLFGDVEHLPLRLARPRAGLARQQLAQRRHLPCPLQRCRMPGEAHQLVAVADQAGLAGAEDGEDLARRFAPERIVVEPELQPAI